MDQTDLINALLTQAGIIMEDASVTAIIIGSDTPIDIRLQIVREAGADIVAIVGAIDAIRRRGTD